MKIILASSMGFCFGVQRAVDLATKLSKEEIKAATFGPLIHNPQLVEKLKQEGINCKNTLHEFQTNEKVIIRSHGVGPEIYQQMESLNLSYADATCPFVKKAQIAAQNFANNDYLPIIIGEKEHPEVKSIKAWGGETAFVVESEADFSQIPFVKKYGVVAQTTFNKDRFKDLLQKIQTARPGNYEVNLTICSATESRQTAALELASISDAIIVIGGKNSANTKHLVELVRQVCSRVYHIETAEEITKNMLHNITTVGVTAGASTPDWLIKEAVNKMESMESMESLLEEMIISVHPGASVKGTIVAITRDEVIIDFGYQSEGRIAFDQWSKDADKTLIEENFKVGDEVEAKVVARENNDGFIELSRLKLEQEKAWDNLGQLAEGEVMTVEGLAAVKGGITVKLEGNSVIGFIPASHLALARVNDLAVFIGQKMQVNVLEFDKAKKRLVLSRREILRNEKAAKDRLAREEKQRKIQEAHEQKVAAEELAYASIEEGSITKGIVKKIVDFGLFIELNNGLQGLLHTSELSWDKGIKPIDFAKEGDTITVLIKSIDKTAKRIALSVKMLTNDPWQEENKALREGMNMDATISRFLPFGAIATLSKNVEGLIHISEIAEEKLNKPEEKLKIGDKVRVKLLKIDRKNKKIALSIIKAVLEEEKAEYTPFLNAKPNLSIDLSKQLASLIKE